ncbi:hypothetical protein DOM21_12520 [Bacteriovorax stolpii]|uniref:ATP-binding cassette domain-containing protein n=1 Tax=Bacteriovorax stolpii TaxID=960 RepID=UPI001157BAEF|nr:ABC transporter ATP-binding protein [Bacteriovorax stolpii]QDK42250.1 hypothetical protein DOM21_12520 [Bacteriovorax stolpii]
MKHPLIQIQALDYCYPGSSKMIIKGLSQTVEAGEIIGVVGKNGVGKSTLMRLLASLQQPVNGEIRIGGVSSIDIEKRREYLLNLQYISHDKEVLKDFKIKEYFQLYSCLYPGYSKKIEKELISRFEIDDQERISKLSTGNRIKVFLIFSLSTQTPLILLDEVTAVLDPDNRVDLFNLMKEFKQKGISFVVATNIVEDLVGLSDKVWFINKGAVAEVSDSEVSSLFKKKAS